MLEPLTRSRTLYADARANAMFVLLDTVGNRVAAELRGATAYRVSAHNREISCQEAIYAFVDTSILAQRASSSRF